MGKYLPIILGGLVGGLLRGVLGISKDLITKKEETINYGFIWPEALPALPFGFKYYSYTPHGAALGGQGGFSDCTFGRLCGE